MIVFQKEWINIESANNVVGIFEPENDFKSTNNDMFRCKCEILDYWPHGGAIKVDQKPFVRVEIKRIG